MADICCEAENTLNHQRIYNDMKEKTPRPLETAESVASAACMAGLDEKEIKLYICMTETGKAARLISKYRPKQKILACAVSDTVYRQMNIMRGVYGFKIPTYQGCDHVISMVME